ncbi:hypothetical protein [Acuticoccus yangtzensis]|uniref:hypothetical protein n=1 Tax=Acuticoccus yangtzensis TaxID=1443441 RepID=UPI000AB43D6B|nr:hypothetical protein [Acuticoccus yangtzensis]
MLWNKKRTRRRRRSKKSGLLKTAGVVVLTHIAAVTPSPLGWLTAAQWTPEWTPEWAAALPALSRAGPSSRPAARASGAPVRTAAATRTVPRNVPRPKPWGGLLGAPIGGGVRASGRAECLTGAAATAKAQQAGRRPLRERFRYEEADLSPFLAANPRLLAMVTGLTFKVTALEHRVGRFEADILAATRMGPLVIENQFGSSDHDHLGKLLTYMAGTGARDGIWVAERFRPEHLAALRALEHFRIHAVALSYVKGARRGPVVVARSAYSPGGRPACRAARIGAGGGLALR